MNQFAHALGAIAVALGASTGPAGLSGSVAPEIVVRIAQAAAWGACVSENARETAVPRPADFDPTVGCERPGGPDTVPVGPPPGVLQGPPADVPVGPPGDIPQGPPADVPHGPPAGVPPGPPAALDAAPPPDVPVGPPGSRGRP